MNQRLKELAEQARNNAREYVEECKHYGHHMEHNEYELQFEKRFADLIFWECEHIFVKVWYEQGMDFRGAELGKFIKRCEHYFGVHE